MSQVIRTVFSLGILAFMFGLHPWERQGDGATPEFYTAWGAGEAGNRLGQYDHPIGIAFYKDPNGRRTLVIVDSGNNLIRWETRLGMFLQKFGKEGIDRGEFRRPTGIAVDSDGIAYICDTGNDRIQIAGVWTDRLTELPGKCHAVFGTTGDAPGQFRSPQGIALDRDRNIYVADTGNHRIQVFDVTGKFLGEWGSQGTAEGRFTQPSGIAIHGESLFVTDSGNHRVQKFDLKGTFIAGWDGAGGDDGRFSNPQSIAVDPQGTVYVVDTGNHRIQMFDVRGGYLGCFGKKGSQGGDLLSPKGIATDDDGIYITDEGNHRIQRFRKN
jgi:DNA-binding beta-propeller fold protein YncE